MYSFRFSEKSRGSFFYRRISAFSISYIGNSSTAETPSHSKAKLTFIYVLNLLKWTYLRFPYETFVFNTPEKIILLLISLAMITEEVVP